MLIISRRVGETVYIALSRNALKILLEQTPEGHCAEITSTVLGVKGNVVRVGINAPGPVAIHRQEIYERLQQQEGTAPSFAKGMARP